MMLMSLEELSSEVRPTDVRAFRRHKDNHGSPACLPPFQRHGYRQDSRPNVRRAVNNSRQTVRRVSVQVHVPRRIIRSLCTDLTLPRRSKQKYTKTSSNEPRPVLPVESRDLCPHGGKMPGTSPQSHDANGWSSSKMGRRGEGAINVKWICRLLLPDVRTFLRGNPPRVDGGFGCPPIGGGGKGGGFKKNCARWEPAHDATVTMSLLWLNRIAVAHLSQ